MSAWTERAVRVATTHLAAQALRDSRGLAASVVIATRNRATYLDLTLAALERQCIPADSWEVVAVDLTSSDETPEVIDRYQRRRRVRISSRTVPSGRRADAFSVALDAAQGPIVVFLGDDRVASPDFLLGHLIRHTRGPCVVIGDSHRCIHTHLFALSEPDWSGPPGQPALEADDLDHPERWAGLLFDQGGDYRPLFAHFDRRRAAIPSPWVYFDSGNASVPREYLERVGGFAECWEGCGQGDRGLADTELGYQLYKSGLPFRFEPRAFTLTQLHPEPPVPPAERLRGVGQFFSKHPELDRARLEPILLGGGAPLGASA